MIGGDGLHHPLPLGPWTKRPSLAESAHMPDDLSSPSHEAAFVAQEPVDDKTCCRLMRITCRPCMMCAGAAHVRVSTWPMLVTGCYSDISSKRDWRVGHSSCTGGEMPLAFLQQ